MNRHLFVFNIVGLSPKHLQYLETLPAFSYLISNGTWVPMKPVFPCLTIPAQASITTGTYPCEHGMIANGLFYKDRLEVSFWDQFRSLLQVEPFWERIKRVRPELKTAILFWQNTLYGNSDIIITPRPIHTEHQLIQWCYSKPVGLYEELARELKPFELLDYWGPFASSKSSRWIMNAAITVLKQQRPHLMMIYIPHLDYSSQRSGPEDPSVLEDLKVVDELIGNFLDETKRMDLLESSVFTIFSEYSFSRVTEAVCLNRLLRQAGFLKIREIEGKEYLDYEMSTAFAMVDHQIAHVYVHNEHEEEVMAFLKTVEGVQLVLNGEQQKEYKVNHERAGELLAVARPDRWFAYYWWETEEKVPDFAHGVDIHRKPGYDPLELFFDSEKMVVPTDTSLIKGSHGASAGQGERMAVFMMSGKAPEDIFIREQIEMVDIMPILEGVLIE